MVIFRNTIRQALFLCQIALVFGPAGAQITSTEADFSDSLEYAVFPWKDPYFVFNTPQGEATVAGSLEAGYLPGTPPFDFTWSRWNAVGGSFEHYSEESSVTNSALTGLEGGCYRVEINSTDTDTVFRAWVFLNDPTVTVTKDPATGKVVPYAYSCDYLQLEATLSPQVMVYYDLATNQALYIENGMRFRWTSDNDDFEIPGPTVLEAITIYNEPPFSRPPTRDTRFTITATDSFGLERTDEVLYESVHVKAEFEMLAEDENDPGPIILQEQPSGGAPFFVRFRNLSENGFEFKWVLVDSAKSEDASEIITHTVEDSVENTYYYPGYYFPKLYAYSEQYCVDSFPLIEPVEIYVKPSHIDVMNVFSPNEDGLFDRFLIDSKSLKNFRITIYSRMGKKVYEYEQTEDKMDWEGWDGTIFGRGNREAETGVYFYVIEALGWDARKYRGREPYTGFVYLFRGKGN